MIEIWRYDRVHNPITFIVQLPQCNNCLCIKDILPLHWISSNNIECRILHVRKKLRHSKLRDVWEILSLQSWNFFKVLYSPLYHGLDFIYLHTQINTWRTPFQFSLIQNHLKLCWATIRRVLYLHISYFRIERKCRCLAVLSYKEIVLIALVFGKRTPLYILCSEY